MASCEGNGDKMKGVSNTNPSGHNKKRKQSSSINDGNGGCNCRKSKCMQLYCECLRAGNLCKESCDCEDCWNNLEHKEYVSEKKKEIELRDPHAFEPKIVVDNVARHRKGCNCSNSECKNKHCGCFSFGVGCSPLCRCQGCRNGYGTKDSSLVPTEKERTNKNNGCNKPERMDNGSSSQSHRAVVNYGNSFTQVPQLCHDSSDVDMIVKKKVEDYSFNVNNINMPILSNQVMPVPRKGPAAVSTYSYSVVENRLGCMNEYGIKDSSFVPKEQKRANENNSCNNEPERMDNGSSSQSHHTVVDYGNFFTQEQQLCHESSYVDMIVKEEVEGYYRNVNNINMPILSNQVMPVPRRGPAVVSTHSYSIVENGLDTPHYQLQTPAQIFNSPNIIEQQNTDMVGDIDWQGQSSFLGPPNFYDDDNFAELSTVDSFMLMEPTMQSSQQDQLYQNYDFYQEDAENNHHPHLDGHGTSSMNEGYANFPP